MKLYQIVHESTKQIICKDKRGRHYRQSIFNIDKNLTIFKTSKENAELEAKKLNKEYYDGWQVQEYFSPTRIAKEKQIPKKPIKQCFDSTTIDGVKTQVFYSVCPCCNQGALSSGMRYCAKCGQALDWKSEENE